MILPARLTLRPTYDVAIPGLYAWGVTVAWPLRERDHRWWVYGFGGLAFIALVNSSWLVSSGYRLWSMLSIILYVSASAAVWFLLGSDASSLGLLGVVGYAAFAIGWVRANGTRDVRDGVPAHLLDVPPRRVPLFREKLLLFFRVLGAAVPMLLAWRIDSKDRALLGHAIALLGALQILSIASTQAVAVGQKADSPSFPWTAIGRTLLFALVVSIGCWLTFALTSL